MVVAAVVGLATGNLAGQIKDSERFIKLGTRLPPVAPGDGGQVEITAPPEWCKDATYLLELQWLFGIGGRMPVVRLPTGPSACDWTFDSLPAGRYSATIQRIDSEEIVAVGSGELTAGGTVLVTLEAGAIELEGRLVAAGLPPGFARLVFSIAGGPDSSNSWDAVVGREGEYHVRVASVGARATVCISVEAEGRDRGLRTTSLTKIRVDCRSLERGFHRRDFDDVKVPPGMIRIAIAPADQYPKNRYAWVRVDNGPNEAAFWPGRGFRGQALATFGPHTLTITLQDSTEVIGRADVTVTPDQPVPEVSISLK
jgi:hypothetical protein